MANPISEFTKDELAVWVAEEQKLLRVNPGIISRFDPGVKGFRTFFNKILKRSLDVPAGETFREVGFVYGAGLYNYRYDPDHQFFWQGLTPQIEDPIGTKFMRYEETEEAWSKDEGYNLERGVNDMRQELRNEEDLKEKGWRGWRPWKMK